MDSLGQSALQWLSMLALVFSLSSLASGCDEAPAEPAEEESVTTETVEEGSESSVSSDAEDKESGDVDPIEDVGPDSALVTETSEVEEGDVSVEVDVAVEALDTTEEDVAPVADDVALSADIESDTQEAPPEDIVEAPAPPPPVVTRISPWPGRGMQIYVEQPEPGIAIEVRDASGAPYATTVSQLSSNTGLTLIAIEGSADFWEHLERTERARQLAEGLPEGERIAVWSQGAFASDFTAHRAQVVSRIQSLEPMESTPTPVESLESILGEVEGPFGAVHRDLVIIGEADDDAPSAESILARRSRLVRVGVCPNMDEDEAFVLSVGGATALLEAPEPMADMAWVPCSAASAAIDAYPFGDTIAFYMSDEEHADFQWHVANKSKEEWPVNVAIGPGLPQSAVGHIRGNSSLNCQRKSMTINLDGGHPRRLAPGGADDEFMLISMCLDDRYFQQFLANGLLQELGLFQPRQRYVRLTINGDDYGVYLLLENPTETIQRRHAAVEGVLRRRNEAKGTPADIKWPSDPDAAQLVKEQFEALNNVVWTTEGPELPAALAERMDVEMFIQWLAFHTYVRNGDYVDEVYLFASLELGEWFFRISGWDADDLLSDCHHGGQNALYDPWGIYYCAEGNLEHALLYSPVLYERFIDHLEALITEVLPYEKMASAIFAVRDALFAHLDEESVCAAMVELINANPSASTCAGAKADIESHMQDFLSGISTRSTNLLNQIDVYRGAQ